MNTVSIALPGYSLRKSRLTLSACIALFAVAGCSTDQSVKNQTDPVMLKSSDSNIKVRDVAAVGTWRQKITDINDPKITNGYLTIKLEKDGTGSWSDAGSGKGSGTTSPITWYSHGDTVALSFVRATEVGAAIASSQTMYAKISLDKNSLTYFVNDKPEGTLTRVTDK